MYAARVCPFTKQAPQYPSLVYFGKPFSDMMYHYSTLLDKAHFWVERERIRRIIVRDIVGIFASGLCLVHCVLTPVLPVLGGLGFLGAFLEERLLHLALLVPALILALASFPTACRHHQRHAIMVVGFSGALLLMVALYLAGIWEILVSIVGAGLLIMAHWINRRLMLRVAPAD